MCSTVNLIVGETYVVTRQKNHKEEFVFIGGEPLKVISNDKTLLLSDFLSGGYISIKLKTN